MTAGATSKGVDAAALEAAWRNYSRPVLATLIRLLRDFDRAEEALHDAFLAAAKRWPEEGMPNNPVAWLVSAGRFSSIDRFRRTARFAAAQSDIAQVMYPESQEMPEDEVLLTDDQLRLIFVCCHPILPHDARVALTLREVCGLTTEDIARAVLARTPTIAQRIVRAKARLKEAGLPYEVPGRGELPARLDAVLSVVYLMFNEGYFAHEGPTLIRGELCDSAIRLGRLLAELLPTSEVLGLLGLMLLHQSRREARETDGGDIVLFADQDRSLWNSELIGEGHRLVERAFRAGDIGPYALQGAIAAVHLTARTPDETNWDEIVGLYGLLMEAAPSPVVRLNRAVAIYMARGVGRGLAELEAALGEGGLEAYGPAFSVAAEMYAAACRTEDARTAYRRAIELSRQEPERRLLERKLAELEH